MSHTVERAKSIAAERRKRTTAAAILSLPLILFAAVFVIYPLASGALTAFQSSTLLNQTNELNGIANFISLFRSGGFAKAAGFTIGFSAVVVAIEMVLGFGLALLMNRVFPGKKLVFTLLLLPIMVAPALLGVMFRLLLNGDIGALPALLESFGLNVSLFSPDSIVPLLVVLDVLQWTPFTFLIIYAGLQSFPKELLEASSMDGAGYFRSLTSVVIPVLKPVLFAAFFLRAIDAIRTFDVIYVLTAGGPGTSTTTLSIYIYKTAFESGDFGKAAAAALVVLVVLIPFVPLIVRRISSTGMEAKK
ncbi:carbohydrate ABC transporter permease [Microbacterium sp. zg.Y1084]|uniref:carbohydrate ABC transporter permease n=1 Tax=Microbacterium sp. zg.Y1084 TaxID=2969667 RepID=UPI00214B8262|nr:sugar ABC transporter permease [Microbacterium sp. zg.Y1084]MCR2813903.1 sugar ABC transporter permease [Microbacterium sp. zg.Y1084]